MFTYERLAQVAIVIWLLTWLPGIFLFVFKVTNLLQSDQRSRALLQGFLLASIPVAAWGLYDWSEMMIQIGAGVIPRAAGTAAYLANATGMSPRAAGTVIYSVQMVCPYLASSIAMFWMYRTMGSTFTLAKRIALIMAGLIAAPIVAPAPFFSLLMMLLGG